MIKNQIILKKPKKIENKDYQPQKILLKIVIIIYYYIYKLESLKINSFNNIPKIRVHLKIKNLYLIEFYPKIKNIENLLIYKY